MHGHLSVVVVYNTQCTARQLPTTTILLDQPEDRSTPIAMPLPLCLPPCLCVPVVPPLCLPSPVRTLVGRAWRRPPLALCDTHRQLQHPPPVSCRVVSSVVHIAAPSVQQAHLHTTRPAIALSPRCHADRHSSERVLAGTATQHPPACLTPVTGLSVGLRGTLSPSTAPPRTSHLRDHYILRGYGDAAHPGPKPILGAHALAAAPSRPIRRIVDFHR